MARKKLTEEERERFRLERERMDANTRRLRSSAEKAQAELDAKNASKRD